MEKEKKNHIVFYILILFLLSISIMIFLTMPRYTYSAYHIQSHIYWSDSHLQREGKSISAPNFCKTPEGILYIQLKNIASKDIVLESVSLADPTDPTITQIIGEKFPSNTSINLLFSDPSPSCDDAGDFHTLSYEYSIGGKTYGFKGDKDIVAECKCSSIEFFGFHVIYSLFPPLISIF
jgi:hypothetical protein